MQRTSWDTYSKNLINRIVSKSMLNHKSPQVLRECMSSYVGHQHGDVFLGPTIGCRSLYLDEYQSFDKYDIKLDNRYDNNKDANFGKFSILNNKPIIGSHLLKSKEENGSSTRLQPEELLGRVPPSLPQFRFQRSAPFRDPP